MRLLFLSLLITIICFSCTRPTGIKDLVQSSDSVAINFFKGDGTRDTVVKVMILRDKKQVQDLAGFIESGTIKNVNCGYDGSIHFFKNNMVVKDIDFKMNDAQCMHFSFVLDKNIYSTKLSAEAKTFLEAVKK
jgi:hypothetical protein